MEKRFFIYVIYRPKILNNRIVPASKLYVGIHYGTDDDNYMGSGVNIQLAYKKYGKENFVRETLAYYDTPEEASKMERELVNEESLKEGWLYNIVPGGSIPDLAMREYLSSLETSLTTREKMALKKLGANNPNFGKEFSAETRRRMSISAKNRKKKSLL